LIRGKLVVGGSRRVSESQQCSAERFWSNELKKFASIKVSIPAIATIDKLGLDAYCRREGFKLS
jgi:ribosomal protein L28